MYIIANAKSNNHSSLRYEACNDFLVIWGCATIAVSLRASVMWHWKLALAAYLTSLSFSPDRSRLASGSRDETVRLWNCASGVPIAVLRGHSHPVASLSFSLNGSRLTSGSDAETVILWDCATWALIATIKGDPQSVYSLSCSPDGSKLPSMSTDTILSHCNSDINASFSTLNTRSDCFLFIEEMIYILLHESEDPSRCYYIQGNIPSSDGHVPLLWLLVDTPEILEKAFCSTAAAFGGEE